MRKKIHQYNIQGNFIRTWNSIIEAARSYRVDESVIRKAAKRRNISQNSYWSKYKFSNYFTPAVKDASFPKILIFDIETTPLLASIWRLKTDYVQPNMLEVNNWYLLSWSAKWLMDNEMMHDALTPEEIANEDDYRVSQSIWELIDKADIVISHNGINFDHKLLNMRWLLHGLPPPGFYRVIDTYRSAKTLFNFPSHKLDFIAKQLGLGGKLDHEGFEMWRKSTNGDQGALDKMVQYNDQDVRILEDVYLIIRPWIKNHPNLGVFIESETPVCRVCGSTEMYLLPGQDYTTNLSKYETLRCTCGALNKRRTQKLSKEIRKSLMSGFPA